MIAAGAFDEAALVVAALSSRAEEREEAFRRLYESLSPRLYSVCFGITRDAADAQDAVQETFVSIQRALPEFRGGAQLSTWAYQIAVRAAVQVRSRRARHSGEEVDAQAMDPRPGVEEAVEARQRKAHLDRAMKTLSLEHRTVLSLFAVEGLSHQEIARILGIPEGTVWSRLHLARKRLAAAMQTSASASPAR